MKTTNDDIASLTVAVVGHVDHGKSTVIGRLLAETDALPRGKLQQVKERCARQAKPFEYAFLLDALQDEQTQGITIDMARCFFRTAKRRYLIVDAPGHIEFLRNMITGAAKAAAALVVIDAREGIQENSKRHGYVVSMLGIRQVAVIVNKMDLVDYGEAVYRQIVADYGAFLGRLGVRPVNYIPVSAREGDNIAAPSANLAWYDGPTVLGQFDAFAGDSEPDDGPLRFPVQDVYRFTEEGDDRRLLAGTVRSGRVAVGDAVRFLPGGKRARIETIEAFNAPPRQAVGSGEVPGFTISPQLYIRPGEVMVKESEPAPQVAARFRASLFWLGQAPMIKGKTYKLRLASARATLRLAQIDSVLDASDLTSREKQEIERHDVADCILETQRPVAFDLTGDVAATSRFVVIDNYEIAGAGIITEALPGPQAMLEEHVREREFAWRRGKVTPEQRAALYHHRGKFVVFIGESELAEAIATRLEQRLFSNNYKAYFLGQGSVLTGLDADLRFADAGADEHLRRLGELARILTDSGQIFITRAGPLDQHDLRLLERLNRPHDIVVISVGAAPLPDYHVALHLPPDTDVETGVSRAFAVLCEHQVIGDYSI